jgi:hypothetical protein
VEDDELITSPSKWKREAIQDWTIAGHWYQEKQIDGFQLGTYWNNTVTIGILTERATGLSLMVFEDFHKVGQWRIAE